MRGNGQVDEVSEKVGPKQIATVAARSGDEGKRRVSRCGPTTPPSIGNGDERQQAPGDADGGVPAMWGCEEGWKPGGDERKEAEDEAQVLYPGLRGGGGVAHVAHCAWQGDRGEDEHGDLAETGDGVGRHGFRRSWASAAPAPAPGPAPAMATTVGQERPKLLKEGLQGWGGRGGGARRRHHAATRRAGGTGQSAWRVALGFTAYPLSFRAP